MAGVGRKREFGLVGRNQDAGHPRVGQRIFDQNDLAVGTGLQGGVRREFVRGHGLCCEEFDLVRVIYMGEDATTEGSPTLLGHSVGRWDGSELVVETRGISWQFFDSSGLQHSDELELVERFAVNADGSELNYTLIATDPATFTEPVTLTKEWLWRPGEVVRPYECTTG